MDASFLSHADAALRNRNTILHYVKKHAPVSRTDIWENIDMSRAAVTKIVRDLQEMDLLAETEQGQSTGGRRPLFMVFNGRKRLFFAFDWISQSLFLMNLNGDIHVEKKIHFEASFSPDSFANALNAAIDQLLAGNTNLQEKIVGIVLAMPGIIDEKNCTVLSSVELGWQNVAVNHFFSERFGSHVYMERTGNLLVLSAATHFARNYAHIQLFTLGTDGIGVSSLIHGNCQHGAWCMHGELGHIKLVSDIPCPCGQVGCLEAIVNHLFKKNGGKLTNEILDYLAIGVSTAVNICDSHIVLTGSYIDMLDNVQKDYLVASIRSKVTSASLRQFDVHFAYNKKQLMLQGLCDYMFECMFPVV